MEINQALLHLYYFFQSCAFYLTIAASIWALSFFARKKIGLTALESIFLFPILICLILIIFWTVQALGYKNLFLINLFMPLELFFTLPFFFALIYRPNWLKPAIYTMIGYLTVFCLIFLSGVENFEMGEINSYVRLSGHLLISGLAVWALTACLEHYSGMIFRRPEGWFVVGILIYYAPTTLIMIFFNVFSSEEQFSLWVINNFSDTLRFVSFLIAFYFAEKKWDRNSVEDPQTNFSI